MAAAAPPSLCGESVSSRRGLLASLWTLLTLLQSIAFVTALIFTLSAKDSSDSNNNAQDDQQNNQHNEQNNQESDPEMAVTSRAMAFAALWTAVLATLMSIFGTVILGWQSPTGQYYTCCASRVHKTTPLALGSFVGALLMFANMTLVCSVLFGEFEIRDQQQGGGNNEADAERKDTAVHRSSMAFSIMCLVLTVLYFGFAALTFAFSKAVLSEMADDDECGGHGRMDDNTTTHRRFDDHRGGSTRSALTTKNASHSHFVTGYDGYIGERFDVVGGGMRPAGAGFVAPTPAVDGTMA